MAHLELEKEGKAVQGSVSGAIAADALQGVGAPLGSTHPAGEPVPSGPEIIPHRPDPAKTPEEQAQINALRRRLAAPDESESFEGRDLEKEKESKELFADIVDLPISRALLGDPSKLNVAKRDFNQFTYVERRIRMARLGVLVHEFGAAAARWRDTQSPEDKARVEKLKKAMLHVGLTSKDVNDFMNFTGPAAEIAGQMWASMIQRKALERVLLGASAGAVAGAIAVPGVGAPPGALGGAMIGLGMHLFVDSYISEGGFAYSEMRDKGVPHETASWISQVVGVINGGLELGGVAAVGLPFKKAAKVRIRKQLTKLFLDYSKSKVSRKLIAKRIAQAYSLGVAGEVMTEVLEEVVQIAGEFAASIEGGKPEDPLTMKNLDRIAEVAWKTFKGMVILGSPGPSLQAKTEFRDRRRAKAAIQAEKEVKEAVKAVQEGKVSLLDPPLVREHLGAVMAEAGNERIYVPVDKMKAWAQAHENREILFDLNVENQMERAEETGGDVEIKFEDLMSSIMDNSYDTLSQHIRLGEDGMTAFEAEEILAFGPKIDLSTIDAFGDLKQSAFAEEQGLTGAPIEQVNTDFAVANLDSKGRAALANVSEKELTEAQEEIEASGDNQRPRAISLNADGSFAFKDDIAHLAAALKLDVKAVPIQFVVEPATGPVSEQIHALGLQSMITDANSAGLSPAKWKAYAETVEKQRNMAEQRLEANRLTTQQRLLSKERVKMLKEEKARVEEELAKEPIFAMLNGLASGFRLDKEQLQEEVEARGATLEELPTAGPRNRRIYATAKTENSITLSIYAEVNGFESVDAMVDELLATDSFKKTVEREARENVRARTGELDAELQLLEDAKKAVLESQPDSVLAAELAILREQAGMKRVGVRVIRNIAKQLMKKHTVRQISSRRFEAKARRAGQEAGVLFRKGLFAEAAEKKYDQIVNFNMAVMADKARAQVEKRNTQMRRWSRFKKSRELVPTPYQHAMLAVLSTVKLKGKFSTKDKAALLKMSDVVSPPLISEELLEGEELDYRDMTLEEFNRVYQTVADIRQKGLMESRTVREWHNRQLDQGARELGAGVRKNLSPIKEAAVTGKRRHLNWFAHSFTNIALSLKEIDGFKPLGAAFGMVKQRFDEAMSTGYLPGSIGFQRRKADNAKTMNKMWKIYTTAEQKRFSKKSIWKRRVPGIDKTFSQNEFIALLLNTGNPENRKILIETNKYTEEQLDAVRNEASEKDIKFANAAWAHIKTFFPDVVAAEQRRRNYTPPMVVGDKFEATNGTLEGGYYPIISNRQGTVQGTLMTAEEHVKSVHGGRHVSTMTERGFTIARSKMKATDEILLDTFGLELHLDQVIYDLEVGDAVTDIWKVLHHKETVAAFNEMGALNRYKTLTTWAEDITTDQINSRNTMQQGMRYIRGAVTVASLAYNASVGAVQLLGLSQSSVRLGHKNLLWAMVRTMPYMKSPFDKANFQIEYMHSVSGFMASRGKTWNKDLLDAQTALASNWLDIATPGNSAKFTRLGAFWMIRTLQGYVDIVTWTAAMKQASTMFATEKEMVLFADEQVRSSQGSGIFGDRTAWERGNLGTGQTEVYRAFTVFMNYFVTKNNLAIERFKSTNFKNPIEMLAFMRDMIILYAFEAILLGQLRGEAPDFDDDDDSWALWAGGEVVRNMVAGVPLAREVSSELLGFRGGGTIGSSLAKFGRLGTQLFAGELDSGLMRAGVNIAGLMFRFPAAQTNKILRAIEEQEEGGDPNILDFAFGPAYRKKK
jgi:hypothetical protein